MKLPKCNFKLPIDNDCAIYNTALKRYVPYNSSQESFIEGLRNLEINNHIRHNLVEDVSVI